MVTGSCGPPLHINSSSHFLSTGSHWLIRLSPEPVTPTFDFWDDVWGTFGCEDHRDTIRYHEIPIHRSLVHKMPLLVIAELLSGSCHDEA